MALTNAQKDMVQALQDRMSKLKETTMSSQQCTMAGMGNYFFEEFKAIEKQLDTIKKS